ncbi:EEF1A lysine methyltransferase 2 [Kryptolebias marmoratus]|uniref:EEF1A lysine methyltransferase 2 n=1 Tax=Kryptolebias marmoratus TaxID=37003 RepID=A0A3Q3BEE1_KRYMA|nr:EEF1A lysine methyltransferase 2 [Kryptolebias marmoratus]
MDAAMMETSLSIPMPPAVAGSFSDARPSGKCRRRLDTIYSSMADGGDSSHGCENNSDSEEDRCSDDDFETSKLGTREYWEETYQKELDTFKDIGDVGEIWFGEESMSRVLRWMDKAKIPESAAILDIGTGNGAFLVELANCGYRNLTGIDYSPASVELARNVLQAEDLTDVTVKEMDFLNSQGELKGFDVCIDKGTFDAISLNPDNTKEGKKLYVQALKDALKDNGFFAITSCNWTKEQLRERFSEGFEFVQELPTPSFKFGGKTGNNVSALIFKRVH